MSTIDNLKTIRKEVARARGVEAGTVVRFVRTVPNRDHMRDVENGTIDLTYAAVYVGGRWYLTGTTGMGTHAYTNRDFFDLMASENVSQVEVATAFEEV